MNLTEVAKLLQDGQMSISDAAKHFNFTEQRLKFSLTRYKERFSLVVSTLEKIKNDEIGREEAAQTLGITTRDVNKLQESWGIKRPIKKYRITREASQIKWQIHKKYAIDFIAIGESFDDYAEAAGITVRQMRRKVADLLDKHFEMPYKDLKTLSIDKRKRLAEVIEKAENLEIAEQNVLKSVSDGEMSIEEVALMRLRDKQAKTERNLKWLNRR